MVKAKHVLGAFCPCAGSLGEMDSSASPPRLVLSRALKMLRLPLRARQRLRPGIIMKRLKQLKQLKQLALLQDGDLLTVTFPCDRH